nr:uncharacterized protein LOC119178420 isoform X3 [Rhipicephalus microplus]
MWNAGSSLFAKMMPKWRGTFADQGADEPSSASKALFGAATARGNTEEGAVLNGTPQRIFCATLVGHASHVTCNSSRTCNCCALHRAPSCGR